jgi:hypothetical protein
MLRGVCAPRPPSFRTIEHVTRRPYSPVQTGKGSLQAEVTHPRAAASEDNALALVRGTPIMVSSAAAIVLFESHS